jgi:hypothetical protein
MSENMNSPGSYVVVVNFIQIFPGEFVIFLKNEVVDMKFRGSCKNIALGT